MKLILLVYLLVINSIISNATISNAEKLTTIRNQIPLNIQISYALSLLESINHTGVIKNNNCADNNNIGQVLLPITILASTSCLDLIKKIFLAKNEEKLGLVISNLNNEISKNKAEISNEISAKNEGANKNKFGENTLIIPQNSPVQNSSEESGVNNAIINLVESSSPKIIAHGKNVNVSQESTWPNIIYSVEMGEEYLGGIEIDVMITKDGKLILMHDPTFHNLSKGYNTSNKMRSQFILNNANIAEKKSLSDWDFNLFDEASYYEYKEVKDKFKIFDELSGYDFNIISLSELLKSLRSSDKLIVPNFEKTARAPPKSDLSKKIVDQYATEIKEVSLKNPIAIYIDFKPINNYTRRLYGLSDWHWIRNSWSDEQLRGFTTNSLRKLSEVLNISGGHKNSYIAVRHPEIAKICKSIDDKIIMMASPDNISNIDNADEFIAKFEPFKEFGPKLIEIKYLKHVTDPKIRHWARKNGFKIMFNNISQGDTTQFDGIYKDNQAQLIEDLLKEGGDIVIQTNTISELKNILRKIEKNKNSAFFKKIKWHVAYQPYRCFFTTYVEFFYCNDLANLKTG